MDQYLDSVSIERIAEIRARVLSKPPPLNQSKHNKGRRTVSNDSDSDESDLAEENWEFLMIHTSKKVDDSGREVA